MNRSELLHALQPEIRRRDFENFVDEPPAVARGDEGVVVSGCTTCKKRFNMKGQFADRMADDVASRALR